MAEVRRADPVGDRRRAADRQCERQAGLGAIDIGGLVGWWRIAADHLRSARASGRIGGLYRQPDAPADRVRGRFTQVRPRACESAPFSRCALRGLSSPSCQWKQRATGAAHAPPTHTRPRRRPRPGRAADHRRPALTRGIRTIPAITSTRDCTLAILPPWPRGSPRTASWGERPSWRSSSGRRGRPLKASPPWSCWAATPASERRAWCRSSSGGSPTRTSSCCGARRSSRRTASFPSHP